MAETLEIQLVDATELRSGRGGKRGNGVKYGKYAGAVEPHVEYLKQQIAAAKDHVIRIKNGDMAKALGPDFAKKNATSIYWGLKFTLFSKGIVVDTATHSSGEKVLVMRERKPEDTLPASLAKHLTGVSAEEAAEIADEAGASE